MSNINREQMVAEQLIREHVRKRIKARLSEQQQHEGKLRKVIRRMILEAETGTEEPSGFTGINVLADLLKSIVPVLGDGYKMLTTSEEQRESFRNHIIHAVKNALRPIEVNNDAEKANENYEFEIDADILTEKVSLVVDDDEDPVEAEFIDIEDAPDEDDFVRISDQNETGRNFAAETFKKVEKQVVDAYDLLADDEDRNMFYDYLLTNLLLYFDKFEDELANELPSVSTKEYEEEKAEDTGESPVDAAASAAGDENAEQNLDLEF
tara:strand:+ start:1040 stop:1837 length:798 start_codon:yes stop_codon:yes gene_type:complete